VQDIVKEAKILAKEILEDLSWFNKLMEDGY